jgi:hypothetical protein
VRRMEVATLREEARGVAAGRRIKQRTKRSGLRLGGVRARRLAGRRAALRVGRCRQHERGGRRACGRG